MQYNYRLKSCNISPLTNRIIFRLKEFIFLSFLTSFSSIMYRCKPLQRSELCVSLVVISCFLKFCAFLRYGCTSLKCDRIGIQVTQIFIFWIKKRVFSFSLRIFCHFKVSITVQQLNFNWSLCFISQGFVHHENNIAEPN